MTFLAGLNLPTPPPTPTPPSLSSVDVVSDPLFGGVVEPAAPSAAEELFRRCVSAAQVLHRRGEPLRPEFLVQVDRKIPLEQAGLVLRSTRFRASLAELGIESAEGLTAEQQAFLVAYFSPEMWQRELTTILRATGVTNVQFQGWLKQPAFALEFEQWQEDVFAGAKAGAITSLVSAVEEKKAWAVKLVLAKTHWYDPQGQAAEMHQMLSVLLSILDDELRGDQFQGVMKRIGDRVSAVIPDLANGMVDRSVPSQQPLQLELAPAATIPPLSEFLDDDESPAAPVGPSASLSGEWLVDLNAKPPRTPPTE